MNTHFSRWLRRRLAAAGLLAALAVPAAAGSLGLDFQIETKSFRYENVAVYFAPGQAPSGRVRICVNNQTAGYRELNFNMPGVNAFRLDGRNSQACANFPANAVLSAMTAKAGNGAAKVHSGGIQLAAYDGGMLNFIWGAP